MMNKGMKPNIDSLEVHTCECGGQEFIAVQQLRRVPALLSPIGKPVLIAQELGARCASCGAQAKWAVEDQPKIVTLGGDGNVSNVPVEGNVPTVDKGEGS